jgi:hypothetical protein
VALLNKQRSAIIDEYGELDRRIAEFKPICDRAAALKKEIVSWFERESADQSFVAEGLRYTVQISPKAVERRIVDMAKLFLRIGKAKFLELCRFPLAAIDQHIPAENHSEFLLSERSGNRSVKAVAKASAIRKAA